VDTHTQTQSGEGYSRDTRDTVCPSVAPLQLSSAPTWQPLTDTSTHTHTHRQDKLTGRKREQ